MEEIFNEKTLGFLLAVSALTMLTTLPVGAKNLEIHDLKINKIKSEEITDKYGESVLQKVLYNNKGDIIEVSVEKGEMAYPLTTGDVSILSSGGYYAASKSSVTSRLEPSFGPQLRIYANGFSNSYTSSTKSTSKALDKISVNTTLIMNGAVEHQAADNRTSSSFANASARQQSMMIPDAPQYSRSSHAYHNSGANSVYHSTEAKR